MSVAQLPDLARGGSMESGRRLFLVWQNPETRAFAPVGALTVEPDGSSTFRYLRSAFDQQGFRPLASFPMFNRIYRSSELPPFFENRVMSRRRPDYPAYLSALSLDVDRATPFEVLARTGGDRATDTFHVVAEPEIDPGGATVMRFLASGIRHVEGARERVAGLPVGAHLRVRPEPDNPWNARALLIDAAADQPVGYVPDWMLGFVRHLIEADPDYRLVVEQAGGPDTPSHLLLLCRLEARLQPGYRPFTDDAFDYVEVTDEEPLESS